MSRLTGYFGWIALLLVLGAPALRAADVCANGPTRDAVQHSPFAHGYLHGYEAGFHAGDSDFHLGRPRTLRELRDINRPAGYQPEFGSRGSYRLGYVDGYLLPSPASVPAAEIAAR